MNDRKNTIRRVADQFAQLVGYAPPDAIIQLSLETARIVAEVFAIEVQRLERGGRPRKYATDRERWAAANARRKKR